MSGTIYPLLQTLGYTPERAAELAAESAARSARSERRQRTELVGVRLTPAEHAKATALAAEYGISVPTLLRHLLREHPEPAERPAG